ncbi:polysaccharide deacetylase family protein [Marinifilum caeruleilacunae]|uniref:polysaccharide deacetylase family protein n=1 Tax=Marinifilum caeruleilacunae TaxID=2499076 RepID=UPI001C110E74
MKKICLLTNDVETTSIWFNCLRDETGLKVLQEGMPLLLDIYSKYNIKSTFYFTGYIAKLYPQIVKIILKRGHEVASHGLSHKKEHGFDQMSYKQQVHHLRESKMILEDISGKEVIGFRAPALRVNEDTGKALIESGYLIDSSIASQRFDWFMSFGGRKKLKWLSSPRLPYRTSSESLFKKGNSPIIEVPLSATLLPYLGTTMRIFPLLTRLQHRLLNLENSINHKPIVFDIHPNELIDESNETRSISRRSDQLFAYLFQDLIRAQLKVKNLGHKALDLYDREIKYFMQKNYQFITVREYVENTFNGSQGNRSV